MSYCASCGQELEAGDRFCSGCGKPAKRSPSQEPTDEQPRESEPPSGGPSLIGPEITLSGGDPASEAPEIRPMSSQTKETRVRSRSREPYWVRRGIAGIARDVQWSTVQRGQTSSDSLSLRLERLDSFGNVIENIPVRVERARMQGIVKEGDSIVVKGKKKANDFLTPERIYNRDLNLDFRMKGGAGAMAALVFVLILWIPAFFFSFVPAMPLIAMGEDLAEGFLIALPGLIIIVATFAIAYYIQK